MTQVTEEFDAKVIGGREAIYIELAPEVKNLNPLKLALLVELKRVHEQVNWALHYGDGGHEMWLQLKSDLTDAELRSFVMTVSDVVAQWLIDNPLCRPELDKITVVRQIGRLVDVRLYPFDTQA